MVSIRKELAEHGLIPRKKWGQHFLVDKNILTKVVRAAQIEEEDTVLEVGPGLGEMTLALAGEARKVVAVEIDPKLTEIVKNKTAACSNVEVIGGDILKVDFKEWVGPDGRFIKVVANLPYQISTPLIFRFIESRDIFSTLTLMVQREVAERLVAPSGGKDYGPLSIFVQVFSDLSILFFVKPSAFFPPPNVESAVIHLTWKERPMVAPEEEEWFRSVVKGCMGYRRKTLINGLKHSGLPLQKDAEGRMKEAGIDPRRRPETLTIEEFASLAKALKI
jgi:16S rRNA (adenine1518-N6/adenine1519-N6)-dimethyltransferase